MKANKLPAKYVLTVVDAIDEEPESLVSKKEFPYLSWALKALAENFEREIKGFNTRNDCFPETQELIFDNSVQLSYEISPYCWRYFTVKPVNE